MQHWPPLGCDSVELPKLGIAVRIKTGPNGAWTKTTDRWGMKTVKKRTRQARISTKRSFGRFHACVVANFCLINRPLNGQCFVVIPFDCGRCSTFVFFKILIIWSPMTSPSRHKQCIGQYILRFCFFLPDSLSLSFKTLLHHLNNK